MYLSIVIFCGTLNPIKFSYFVSFIDLSNLLFLTFFIIYGLAKKREYIVGLYKTDFILIICIAMLTLPSIILNNQINNGYLFKHFYPIRILLTYKVITCLFYEYSLKSNKIIKINDFIKPLILLSIISAVLSIVRYIPFGFGLLINDIWPIFKDGEILTQLYWGRLWGTMGGTNTAGNYFTILSLICLSIYYFQGKKIYIFPYLIFSLCVLLSLSFTSILSYIVGLIYIFYKKISVKVIVSAIIVLFFSIFIVNQNETLNKIATKRFGANFSEENRKGSFLPENLQSRIKYWTNFIKISNDEQLHFLYGFGPGGVRLQKNNARDIKIHGNPESFYFRIYNESGLIGLTTIIFFFAYFFRKLLILKNVHQFQMDYIFISLFFLLIVIQSITNEPIYSNGVTQIFTFFIFYISTHYSNYKMDKNLLK